MAKKKPANTKRSGVTFEVRFIGEGVTPDRLPLRAVGDALSAVQDLASGRDPFELSQVPREKSINLVDVKSGSAIYMCVAHAPEEAIGNLERIGSVLSTSNGDAFHGDVVDELVSALTPIKSLSEIAKHFNCRLQVHSSTRGKQRLLAVGEGDYQRISKRLLMTGETTVTGTVQRVGGATKPRCLLRVPSRRKILYCDVENKDLLRRLGQKLYERIVAQGTATWIHHSWRIHAFTIKDFSQPKLGDVNSAIKELRDAGMSAWDDISDPETFLGELRG